MRHRAVVLVLLLAALQIAVNLLWLSLDEGVQYTDAAFHYSQVSDLHMALRDGSEAIREHSRNDEQQRYGDLYYLLAAAVAFVTGPGASGLLGGLSVVLWPLLLLGVYRLGFELAHPERRHSTALLAAVVACLLPGLFNYSRVLVLDLPVAIAVCWCAALLLQSRRAEQERAAARARRWAGLWLIVGLAIKVNALAFLIGPLWVLARPGLKELWQQDRNSLLKRAAGVTTVAAALLAWLLLGPRSDAIITTLVDSTWPGKLLGYAADGALGAYPGHYLSALRSHSWEVVYYSTLQTFSPPLLLATLAATAWFFARERGCRDADARVQRDFVFWSLAIPVFCVVFLLRDIYDERYLVPLLPLCAALIATAALDIPKRSLRRTGIAVLLLGGSLNTAVISFDVLPGLRPLSCVTTPGWAATSRVGSQLWVCALYPEYYFMDRVTRPMGSDESGPLAGDRGDRAVDEIRELLSPTRSQLGRPLEVVFLDHLYGLFYRTFDAALTAGRAGSDAGPMIFREQDLLLVSRCSDKQWLTEKFGSLEQLEATIAAADIVIMRYGTPDDPDDSALRGRRCIVFWPQAHRWQQIGSLGLEDGTSLRLYRQAGDAG